MTAAGRGQPFDSVDLAVTTDFRRVFSEILIRRMGNNQLGYVIPVYSPNSPLGVVAGVDMPLDDSVGADGLFANDFEIGSVGMWSSKVVLKRSAHPGLGETGVSALKVGLKLSLRTRSVCGSGVGWALAHLQGRAERQNVQRCNV